MKKKKIRLRWDNIFKDIIGILVICAICWAVYATAEPIDETEADNLIEKGVVEVFIRTDDPVRDFHRHDAEQEEALKKLPQCCCCEKDEYIQDDHYFLIEGDIYCEEHMVENFRKDTESYIE